MLCEDYKFKLIQLFKTKCFLIFKVQSDMAEALDEESLAALIISDSSAAFDSPDIIEAFSFPLASKKRS